MQAMIALLCGVVFGVGLAISGMTNPAKVMGFLDVAGDWDPTLAFVMGGALAVSSVGFAIARRSVRPWLAATFALPARNDLDAQLIGGAALFGIGWGLVGLCPGPALANLARGSPQIHVFVGAMLVGVLVHRFATAGSPGNTREPHLCVDTPEDGPRSKADRASARPLDSRP
jgi:uncharacterized membrane protein YedE/YeeE